VDALASWSVFAKTIRLYVSKPFHLLCRAKCGSPLASSSQSLLYVYWGSCWSSRLAYTSDCWNGLKVRSGRSCNWSSRDRFTSACGAFSRAAFLPLSRRHDVRTTNDFIYGLRSRCNSRMNIRRVCGSARISAAVTGILARVHFYRAGAECKFLVNLGHLFFLETKI
jgi:hypothetical protein